jgi:hypothetical protein
MNSMLRKYYVIWVALGGVVLGFTLFIILGLGLLTIHPNRFDTSSAATPFVTIIPAPTLTPVVILPTQAQPTVTASPMVVKGDISIGAYVQISGTSGEGLRLRTQPGTQSPMRFLGMDDEVFLVKDGPEEANGFTWWFLQAPYDEKRSGWAAADYLKVIQKAPN